MKQQLPAVKQEPLYGAEFEQPAEPQDSAFELLKKHRRNPSSSRKWDPRAYEGATTGQRWAAVPEVGDLPSETIDNILRDFERPTQLGGAPFDWFLTNHSGWPAEVLERFGAKTDCEAPPRPRFLDHLLSCEIPEQQRGIISLEKKSDFFQDMPQRGSLTMKVAIGFEQNPPDLIFARLAQLVMSEAFDLEKDAEFRRLGRPAENFSAAAREWFRSCILLDIIAASWTLSISGMIGHSGCRPPA